MGILKDRIKSDIILNHEKGNVNQEKVAQIIDIDKGKNICTIYLIKRDGTPSLESNVMVKRSEEGLIQWSPEPGELVQVTEINNRYMITGKYKLNPTSDNNIIKDDIYSSGINGILSGWLGL